MKAVPTIVAALALCASAVPALANDRDVVTVETQSRLRVISAPFVAPPEFVVVAERPIVQGPCVVEVKSNWINGAQVESRSGLCAWADGTVRPAR